MLISALIAEAIFAFYRCLDAERNRLPWKERIRYETRIPKSSLIGLINTLKRRSIIKKHEYERMNFSELLKCLYQKNKINKAYFTLMFSIEIKYRSI